MTTMQIAPPGRRAAGRVLAHLDALTVTQRQVFVLHGATGLSVSETARRTGLARAAVRAIFTGAAQRIADTTATPAPEVFRGSPENPSDQTKNPADLQSCGSAQDSGGCPPAATGENRCPPWCRGDCRAEADGSTFHQSPIRWLDFHEGQQPDVAVARLDDADAPGETTVDLFIGNSGAHTSLTPAQALALAEVLRGHALTAAGLEGAEMPVERLRLDEEFLTAGNAWQAVESLLVDGTAEHLAIYTATEDDTGHSFTPGDLVRVRKAVTA